MLRKHFELNESGKKILDSFKLFAGTEPDVIERLVPAGSDRIYFRFRYDDTSIVAAYSKNVEENRTFIYFTELFVGLGFNVAQVLYISNDMEIYFLEDLGDTSLFQIVEQDLKKNKFTKKTVSLYEKSILELVRMQIMSASYVDFSKCYQISEFNEEAVLFDLNYFKYYFLKTSGLEFNERKLQQDFKSISAFLAESGNQFFMFRDFQARNIMIHNDEPYFIDYQGARKGAIQYDLASLLFQAKAQIPDKWKEYFLDFYVKQVATYIPVNEDEFKKLYYYFVLVRILQTLGAYGLRGLIEKKAHFIESIPFALKNLKNFLLKADFLENFPELHNVLIQLKETDKFTNIVYPKFTVSINSFSYKKGYPDDKTGNGGGFVFDCRGIHNPGRYAEYKQKTGRDREVIEFFKNKTSIDEFVGNVINIVKPTIDNYIERDFNSLNISFGCTGGQHRSVYCAEQMATFIRNNYNVKVRLIHREMGIEEI
jgi:aminoglycoside/choline kinase family phosphotransferase